MFLRSFLLLLPLLASLAWADDPVYYNEVYDQTGKVRPHYEKALEIYKRMDEREVARFLHESRKDFSGDNALDPLPRIITQSEYATLKAGVEQRGTALRMFLQDHYSGRKSYLSVIPKDVIDRIIARSGESGFEGLVKPETIAFPYGPDIVRAADGSWRVIEDNPGFIGGIGDLAKAQEILLKRKPEYAKALGIKNDPYEYYKTVVARARARANPKDGKIVLYMTPPYADKEDQRIRKLFRDEDVEVITPRTKNHLLVEDGEVYIRTPRRIFKDKYERVGFVFVNGEHKWIDATHPVTKEMLLQFEAQAHLEEKSLNKASRKAIEAALVPDPATGRINSEALSKALNESNIADGTKAIIRDSVEGLSEAIIKGKVPTNYAAGVDFIGDKEFYTYVDDLVRHYLKQEPIIRNLPTTRLAKTGADGKPVLDQAFLEDLFKNDKYKGYVIKVVDGRGGDGIYIGPKIKPEEIPEIVSRIKARPEAYIVQPYSHLSVVDDRIVDLRMISDVGPNSVYVSSTPWGRGVPFSGDGKVNLSKHGREFAVVIVDDPKVPNCALQFVRRAMGGH